MIQSTLNFIAKIAEIDEINHNATSKNGLCIAKNRFPIPTGSFTISAITLIGLQYQTTE